MHFRNAQISFRDMKRWPETQRFTTIIPKIHEYVTFFTGFHEPFNSRRKSQGSGLAPAASSAVGPAVAEVAALERDLFSVHGSGQICGKSIHIR